MLGWKRSFDGTEGFSQISVPIMMSGLVELISSSTRFYFYYKLIGSLCWELMCLLTLFEMFWQSCLDDSGNFGEEASAGTPGMPSIEFLLKCEKWLSDSILYVELNRAVEKFGISVTIQAFPWHIACIHVSEYAWVYVLTINMEPSFTIITTNRWALRISFYSIFTCSTRPFRSSWSWVCFCIKSIC